jgi:HNH endonuclease
MTSQAELERQVRERAGNRCEYCRMHQSLQGGTFHVEHVVPVSRGGDSELTNLALACPGCNLHKSDRVQVTDNETGQTVPLFHPRQHPWNEHFDRVGRIPTRRSNRHRPSDNLRFEAERSSPSENPTGRANVRPLSAR